MDYQKDYYAILGVHQTAEVIVIKAAYKALAQRYHPDCYNGLAEDAHAKMTLINEAYSVLSNSKSRNEYDQARGGNTQSADSAFKQDDESDNFWEIYGKDWEIALEYYSDLHEIDHDLSRFSLKTAYVFRCFLLESKDFLNRRKYAKELEEGFLRTYFGKNKEINNFAKQLIFANHRSAALELNNVIRILGDGADPAVIIKKISKKYDLTKNQNSKSPNQRSEKLIKVNYFPNDLIITINGKRVIDGLIEKRFLVKINEFKVFNGDELCLFDFFRDYYENEDEINLDFSGRNLN